MGYSDFDTLFHNLQARCLANAIAGLAKSFLADDEMIVDLGCGLGDDLKMLLIFLTILFSIVCLRCRNVEVCVVKLFVEMCVVKLYVE